MIHHESNHSFRTNSFPPLIHRNVVKRKATTRTTSVFSPTNAFLRIGKQQQSPAAIASSNPRQDHDFSSFFSNYYYYLMTVNVF